MTLPSPTGLRIATIVSSLLLISATVIGIALSVDRLTLFSLVLLVAHSLMYAFLIFFVVLWVVNLYEESVLIRLLRWKRRLLALLIIFVALIAMNFVALFVYVTDLKLLLVAVACYSTMDLIAWKLRQVYLPRIATTYSALMMYYVAFPHWQRLLLQLVWILAIFTARFFVSSWAHYSAESVDMVMYSALLIGLIFSEAVEHCWRSTAKRQLMSEGIALSLAYSRGGEVYQRLLYSLFLASLGLVVIWLANIIGTNFISIASSVHERVGQIGLGLAIMFASGLAYLVKLKFQLAYGTAEIWFGVILIYINSPFELLGNGNVAQFSIQVLAGAFVLVRGLENTHKGLAGLSWRTAYFGQLPAGLLPSITTKYDIA